MKNNLIFGAFLAVMVCIGTIAGCALTTAMTGESPVAIVLRWREEDAGNSYKQSDLSNKTKFDKADNFPSDVQSSDQPESTDAANQAAESDNATNEADSFAGQGTTGSEPVAKQSLESVASVVELAISEGYSNYDVSYDEAGITAKVWYDGVAEELAFIQESGGGADYPEWVVAKNATVEMAKSLRELMDDMGQSDAILVIHVLNDANQENVLLSLINTSIVYDALTE